MKTAIQPSGLAWFGTETALSYKQTFAAFAARSQQAYGVN